MKYFIVLLLHINYYFLSKIIKNHYKYPCYLKNHIGNFSNSSAYLSKYYKFSFYLKSKLANYNIIVSINELFFISKLPHNVLIPYYAKSKLIYDSNVVFPDPVYPV